MTRIAAVHGVLAPHRNTQHDVTDMIARTCLPEGTDRRVLDRLHRSARVTTRHSALPLDAYEELKDFGATNDAFIDTAVPLGAEAVSARPGRSGAVPARRGPADVHLGHRHRRPVDRRTAGGPPRSAARRQTPAHLRAGLCRRSGRAWPGCTTTCSAGPTTWRCCSRSNCARSPSSATTPRWPTWSPPDCSATARRPWWHAGRDARLRGRPSSRPAAGCTRTPST